MKLEKMLPTEVILYSTILGGFRDSNFNFLGVERGCSYHVYTMFIPCLYHVYSVAQENGCTMASVFWISKHWVLEKLTQGL